MLYDAAAAGSEMAANRLDTIRTWLQDAEQAPARTIDIGNHTLAWQRERHEHRCARGFGDAVALRAKTRDQ
jgi:hypothetical protein